MTTTKVQANGGVGRVPDNGHPYPIGQFLFMSEGQSTTEHAEYTEGRQQPSLVPFPSIPRRPWLKILCDSGYRSRSKLACPSSFADFAPLRETALLNLDYHGSSDTHRR